MRWIPPLVGVMAAVIVAQTVPVSWCARDAGEAEMQRALARSVIAQGEAGLAEDFHTGSELFARLFASAYLAGAPIRNGDRLEFVSAGPLGNAIMLAMLSGTGRGSAMISRHQGSPRRASRAPSTMEGRRPRRPWL